MNDAIANFSNAIRPILYLLSLRHLNSMSIDIAISPLIPSLKTENLDTLPF